MNNFVRQWKNRVHLEIRLHWGDRWINMLLFADNKVIMQESESDLQRSLHCLSQLYESYNVKISSKKTKKVMAFEGQYAVHSRIVYNMVEQVSHFKIFRMWYQVWSWKWCNKLRRFQYVGQYVQHWNRK